MRGVLMVGLAAGALATGPRLAQAQTLAAGATLPRQVDRGRIRQQTFLMPGA